jgi:DNA-binding CsgD family transcriptional regulator
MKNLSSDSPLKILWRKFQNFRRLRFSLRLRFYLFFALLVLTISAIVCSMLLASGVLDFGRAAGYELFASEMENAASSIERRFGTLSAMALQMGSRIAKGAENFLDARGKRVNDLRSRPEVLNEMLGEQFAPLMFSLAQARTTGVWMILNATVSARMREATFSRAGLYLVDWEPDLIVAGTEQYQFMRGPSRIALDHELVMEKYWMMEFDVEGADYFSLPQKYALEFPKEAPRICLWFPMTRIKGGTYKAMLCGVPLVDSEGNVFGVCGFDVSDLYFKRVFSPGDGNFRNIFCALAPVEGSRLNLSRSLISWRRLVDDEPAETTTLVPSGRHGGFTLYSSNIGADYVGLHRTLKLHPSGLPFAVQEFALALLVPKKDFDALRAERRWAMTPLFTLISLAGLLISYFFNKIYLRPLLSALEVMHGQRSAPAARETSDATTSGLEGEIPYAKGMANAPLSGESAAESEYEAKIKTLSFAEKKVFDLIVQGHMASDIAQMLNISVNTVKSHNKNILLKMRVASKRELINENIKILKNDKAGK